jgi:hypothetical protein
MAGLAAKLRLGVKVVDDDSKTCKIKLSDGACIEKDFVVISDGVRVSQDIPYGCYQVLTWPHSLDSWTGSLNSLPRYTRIICLLSAPLFLML